MKLFYVLRQYSILNVIVLYFFKKIIKCKILISYGICTDFVFCFLNKTEFSILSMLWHFIEGFWL